MRSGIGIAAIAALAVAMPALAGSIPAVTIDLIVSDGTSENLSPTGTDLMNGMYQYVGGYSNANTDMSWDFLADDTPIGDGAFLGSSFSLMNTSDQTLEYTIIMSMPLSGSSGPITDWAASVGFGVSGIDGTFASLAGTPVWTASADGNPVVSYFNDPFALSFVGTGSASDDDMSAGQIGTVSSSLSIAINFSLSAGETVGSTGVFGVIPAPGALALFGLCGVVGSRRRRA